MTTTQLEIMFKAGWFERVEAIGELTSIDVKDLLSLDYFTLAQSDGNMIVLRSSAIAAVKILAANTNEPEPCGVAACNSEGAIASTVNDAS